MDAQPGSAALGRTPAPVDRDTFRLLSGAFPTGVCVVCVAGDDGRPHGLTTQSFVGLSLEPPMVSVAVARTSRTLRVLEGGEGFVVNILRAGAESVAQRFASKSDEKFSSIPWEAAPHAAMAPMLIEHSVAVIECHRTVFTEVGDHVILVGTVVGGRTLGGRPLMYCGRAYEAWPSELPGTWQASDDGRGLGMGRA